MIKGINEIRDAYNEIRLVERKMHRVKTLHSVGGLGTKETKARLRALEKELEAITNSIPSLERHYYYYKRLYGHPVRPAGKLPMAKTQL